MTVTRAGRPFVPERRWHIYDRDPLVRAEALERRQVDGGPGRPQDDGRPRARRGKDFHRGVKRQRVELHHAVRGDEAVRMDAGEVTVQQTAMPDS